MNEIVKAEVVEFHGQELMAAIKDGKKYVAAKPVCDGMCVTWQPQHRKLVNQKKKYGVTIMVMRDSREREQEMLCIPLHKLDLWLANINPNKIENSQVRAKVEVYQAECAEALYEYWHKGIAICTTRNPLASEEFLEQYYKERRAREILEHDHNLVSPDVSYGTLSRINGLPRTEIVRSYPRSQRKGKAPSGPQLYLDGSSQTALFYV